MNTTVTLMELREKDLDRVSAGETQHYGHLHFGHLHFGQPYFGKLYSGANLVQTNTAVEIAVVIGGGSIVQVINQSNVL